MRNTFQVRLLNYGNFIELSYIDMKVGHIAVMEIIGAVKTYDWGKLGADSLVAKLAAQNENEFVIDGKTAYSELWMGDHFSGPAKVKATGVELGKCLRQKLPYLFKVLSIRKALSIQVHPNKTEAERLHKERPDIYKDPNHKPELAIALTPFLALCGFRPYSEILRFCEELPPLGGLLGDSSVKQLQNASSTDLRRCFEKLMTADEPTVVQCIDLIFKDYQQVLSAYNLLDIFNTVKMDFPKDVGVLLLFFLNVLRLQPGQAIFLAANEIHAYLSGDCIECMACSDNVIRAGLTPKFKDLPQMFSSLNYSGLPPDSKIFQPHRIDAHVQIFIPPVEDFAVAQLSLPSATSDYKMQVQPSTVDCGSILLTLHGERTIRIKGYGDLILKRGSIVYIPPEAAPEIEFVQTTNVGEDFSAYIAMYNSFKQ